MLGRIAMIALRCLGSKGRVPQDNLPSLWSDRRLLIHTLLSMPHRLSHVAEVLHNLVVELQLEKRLFSSRCFSGDYLDQIAHARKNITLANRCNDLLLRFKGTLLFIMFLAMLATPGTNVPPVLPPLVQEATFPMTTFPVSGLTDGS